MLALGGNLCGLLARWTVVFKVVILVVNILLFKGRVNRCPK